MILNTFKVVFFGSSVYCLPLLETLYKNFRLAAVITQPDKPVGRKRILMPTTPKRFSLSHNIKVLSPGSKQELLAFRKDIAQLSADLMVVADYGLLIPQEIFTLPRFQTLNIHFSRLPELRGPTPVQYTVLLGIEKAAITILLMNEEIDSGGIVWQKEVPIANDETTDTLYKKLFNITASEVPSVISQFVQNKLKPKEQEHTKATYTKLLKREDGFIPIKLLSFALNGKQPSASLLKQWPISKYLPSKLCALRFALCAERTIRAFSPWPGVWTEIKLKVKSEKLKVGNKRLKILKAHLEEEKLVPDQVQLEGKQPVSWKQFRQGYPDINLD